MVESLLMAYVRALWVVIPTTLALVVAALALTAIATDSDAFGSFKPALSGCLLIVAALGLAAAGVAAVAGDSRTYRPGRDPMPGEVTLSPAAQIAFSSVIVGVAGLLLH